MTMGADPGVIAVRVLSFREMMIELLSLDSGRSFWRGRSDARGEAASDESIRAVVTAGTGRESANEPSWSQVRSAVDDEVIPHALRRQSALKRLPV